MNLKRGVILAAVMVLTMACICIPLLRPLSLWDKSSSGRRGEEIYATKPGAVQRWGRILKDGEAMDAVDTEAAAASARVQLIWSKWRHGAEHPQTLQKMQLAIYALGQAGDAAGSESLMRRLLDSKERTMGLDHEETLDAVHQLGILFWKKHDDANAEAYFRRELEGRRLGNIPWRTANAAYMLSNTIDRQNKNSEEALELAELAIEEHLRDPNDVGPNNIEDKVRNVREYIQRLKAKEAGTHNSSQ